jgi:uncharacterized protein with HEPN domain
LELLGECARRISPTTRQAYPAILWQDIIGMRNIIAHEYGKIDLDEIWRTMQSDAPQLMLALEGIVASLPPPRGWRFERIRHNHHSHH